MKYCTYITYHAGTSKYYIGKGLSAKVQHGYKGSGTRLKDAFKKYPRDQWATIKIATHETEAEAYEHEKLLIDLELLRDPNCLNIKLGGLGQTTNFKHSADSKRKISTTGKKVRLDDPMIQQRQKVAVTATWADKDLQAAQRERCLIIGARQDVKDSRSRTAKNLIARKSHLEAMIAGSMKPEVVLARSMVNRKINAEKREKRFPPEVVQQIFSSADTLKALMKRFSASNTVIKQIKARDTKYDYAWRTAK
jgi:hypothetical protein